MKSAILLLVTLLALLQLTALAGASIDSRGVPRHASGVYPRARPASILARRAAPKASEPKAKATKANATKAKASKGEVTPAKAKTGKGATAAKKKTTKGAAAAKGSTGAACAWTPGAKGRIGKRADCQAANDGDTATGTYTLLCAQKSTGAMKRLGKRAKFETLGKEDFFTCGGKSLKYHGAGITSVAPQVLQLWKTAQQERKQRQAAKSSKGSKNNVASKLKTSAAEYPRLNHNQKVSSKDKASTKENQLVPDNELEEVGLSDADRQAGMWNLVEFPILRSGELWVHDPDVKGSQGSDRMLLAVPNDNSKVLGVWVATHNNAADGKTITGNDKADSAHEIVPFRKAPEKVARPQVVLGEGAGKGADGIKRDPVSPWKIPKAAGAGAKNT